MTSLSCCKHLTFEARDLAYIFYTAYRNEDCTFNLYFARYLLTSNYTHDYLNFTTRRITWSKLNNMTIVDNNYSYERRNCLLSVLLVFEIFCLRHEIENKRRNAYFEITIDSCYVKVYMHLFCVQFCYEYCLDSCDMQTFKTSDYVF